MQRRNFIALVSGTAIFCISRPLGASAQRWSRLSEQIFRVDEWSLCQG